MCITIKYTPNIKMAARGALPCLFISVVDMVEINQTKSYCRCMSMLRGKMSLLQNLIEINCNNDQMYGFNMCMDFTGLMQVCRQVATSLSALSG